MATTHIEDKGRLDVSYGLHLGIVRQHLSQMRQPLNSQSQDSSSQCLTLEKKDIPAVFHSQGQNDDRDQLENNVLEYQFASTPRNQDALPFQKEFQPSINATLHPNLLAPYFVMSHNIYAMPLILLEHRRKQYQSYLDRLQTVGLSVSLEEQITLETDFF